MFTGLIEAIGRVERVTATEGGVRLEVSAPFAAELASGESVAVNGVCLTHVGARDSARFVAELSPETLRATTLGEVAEGTAVNLERAVRADARLGGHFVLGHVDATALITSWQPEGDHWWLEVALPPAMDAWVVEKGSIAVDGISLTIARLRQGSGGQAVRQGSGGQAARQGSGWTIGIQIVPHTREHTNLAQRQAGERVNLEADIIGKYAARLAELARAR
jgi:riboflavin synthase